MTYTQIIKTSLAVFFLGCFSSLTTFGQTQNTYQNTREILSQINDVKNNSDKLAKLFRVGDERIEDLLKALNDTDRDISLHAQIIIRYLGNDAGMKGLFEWYDKQGQFRVTGPIPLPLSEWDYKVIYASYINEPPKTWVKSEPYIYALALDDSPKAKEALEKMLEISGNLDESTIANQAARRVQASQPAKILTGEQNLAKLVLNNAFFILPDDQKYSSARLLVMNGAKNKGLIEVYINRGRLSEEWYHVVIQKCEQGWRFFSVTQVALS